MGLNITSLSLLYEILTGIGVYVNKNGKAVYCVWVFFLVLSLGLSVAVV